MKTKAVLTILNAPNLFRQGLGFLFFIIAILTAVPAQADINSGLVAWWQFDEGQGFVAHDSSGNGLDIHIDYPQWVTGKIGTALNFDSTNYQNINTATSLDLSNASQVSVSAWFDPGPNGGSTQTLFQFGNGSNANYFILNIADSNNCSGNIYVAANGSACYGAAPSGWHHYVVTYNYDAPAIQLYIDGVLQTPTSSHGGGASTSTFSKHPFFLMGNYNAVGTIDDVRVYNRILSSADVSALYSAGSTADPSASNTINVSLTGLSSGATISGSAFAVTATATSSNANIIGVQFKIDGANMGAEVTGSPYTTTIDTTQFPNGNHILTAEAHDSNGNVTATRIPVIVYNTPPSLPSPTTETYTTFKGNLSVNWSTIEDITQTFGAKGDAERLTANTTASSTTITIDQDHVLSQADVGKVVEIFQAGAPTSGGNYQDLVTTIASVQGAQTAVLAKAPGRTVNAARTIIGTNNATAFQNAVNTAQIPVQFNTTAGSATVTVTGHTLSSQDVGLTVTLHNAVPLPNSVLNSFTSTVQSFTTQVITGNSYYTLTLNTPYYNEQASSISGYFGTNPNAYNFWVTQMVQNQWSSTVTIYPVGFTMAQVSGLPITIQDVLPTFVDLNTTISSVNTLNNTAVLAAAPNVTANGLNGSMDTDSGIVLYVPNGQYLIVPPSLLSSFSMSNESNVFFGFTITSAGIRFQGQDVHHTILLGNGAWQLDGSGQFAERGNMFDVTNPSSGPVTSNLPLEFYNLTFDGGVMQGKRYTSGQYWPASPVTGDGWDLTHDVFLDTGTAREQLYKSFINCIITHWRGEMMKDTGGSGYGYSNYTDPTQEEINDIENTSFIDGDASALNLFFTHTYNNLYVDNVAMAEEYWEGYAYGESTFLNSTIINAGIYNLQQMGNAGITVDGAELSDENTSYRIENNTFDGLFYGIYITPGAHLTIRDNRFLGGVGGVEADDAGYEGGDYEQDFLIEQNYLNGGMSVPIGINGTYQGLNTGITVRHNIGAGGGSYTMSYDIYSNNYGGVSISNTSQAQSYQPEVINDDGSNVYGFLTQNGGQTSYGASDVLTYASGTRHQITWNNGTDPWELDDSQPSTMPTFGPTPILPDPSSGPTTFSPNYIGNFPTPASTDVPATPTMLIYNFDWPGGGEPAVPLYLSRNISGLSPISIPYHQEVFVAWCNSNNISNSVGYCNSNSRVGWNLIAGPETPPAISLTSPSASANLGQGPVNIVMGASATSSSTIAKVDFYVNTYLVGTVTGNQSSYSFTLTNVTSTSFTGQTVDSSGTMQPGTINNVTPGSYLIYAKLTETNGITTFSAPVSIAVNAAIASPSITTQPLSQSVTAGDTATFTVAASSTAALTYQWQESVNNGGSWTPITGATSASYTTPITSTLDNGTQFECIVTNTTGSVTSDAATLTVPGASSSCGASCGEALSTDTSVTLQDAVAVAQYVVGLNPANFNAANAKVDGNSTVTLNDAVLIAKYVVGLITKFPAQP